MLRFALLLRFVLLGILLVLSPIANAETSAPEPSPALAPEPPALPTLPSLTEQVIRPSQPMTRLSPREEPGWFRIGVPEGWQLSADKASGKIALTSADGRGIHIWVLMLPRMLQPRDAGRLLNLLASQVAGPAHWSEPAVQARGDRITASAQTKEHGFAGAAGLSVINVDQVAVALHVVASGPAAAFAQSRDVFAAVLESFVPLGSGESGGGAAGSLAYELFTDPSEGAFTVEVPKGWTVRGGIARKSAVDVRSVVQLVNPDKSILIQAGDTEIPPFLEPWGFLQEGQASGPALVRRYVPGAAFGREYLMWRVKPAMPDLTIETMRPLPELQQLVQSIYNSYATPGVEQRADIGEVLFKGTWNGKPARGHLYAATMRVSVQGGTAMWFTGDIASLQGFVAAEDQIATAVEAMNHMRKSFAVNPNWFAGQQRTTAAVSRITTETNRYISDLISRTYASQQRSHERIFERYSRYQRGVVQVVDPATQQRYEVQTGSNYYWIDSRGVVVGTNAHFNPHPLWFREMLQVAP